MAITDNYQEIKVFPSGHVTFGGQQFSCALGREGIGEKHKEGDGLTPVGRYPLREVFYRADRIAKPDTKLPSQALKHNDGWCDDPHSFDYNKKINLPNDLSHEQLWREDPLYDLIVVVGYNDDPIIPGKGSAIFLHVAKPGFLPTEGCIAFAIEDLQSILKECSTTTVLTIVRSV